LKPRALRSRRAGPSTRCRRAPAGAVLALLAASSLLQPATGLAVDKYAAEFLKIPVGARAIGMGGAFSALADDATAVYWNPAGLIFESRRQIWAEHAEQFGDIANHDFLAFSQPLNATRGGDLQAIGLGFIRSAVDDILVDSLDPSRLVPDEHFIDANGNETWDPGETLLTANIPFELDSVSEMAFMFSYARTIGEKLALGGTVKVIRQSLPDNASFGVGADVGAMYMPTPTISASLRVSDVTTTYLSWDSGNREVLAPSVTLGMQYTRAFAPLRGVVTVAGDMDMTFDNRKTASGVSYGETVLGSDFHGGIEYWYAQRLALRFGATTNALTGGAGFRYRSFGVDYAFIGDHPDLDATHRIGGSYSF
jgi:hypothetical protein